MSCARKAGPREQGSPVTVEQGPARIEHDLEQSTADGLEGLIGATSVLRSELNAHEAICRKVLDEMRVDHEVTGGLPDVRADAWRLPLPTPFAASRRPGTASSSSWWPSRCWMAGRSARWQGPGVYLESWPRGGSRRAPAYGNETATPQGGVPDDARVLSAKAIPDPSPGRHDTVADLTGEPPFR